MLSTVAIPRINIMMAIRIQCEFLLCCSYCYFCAKSVGALAMALSNHSSHTRREELACSMATLATGSHYSTVAVGSPKLHKALNIHLLQNVSQPSSFRLQLRKSSILQAFLLETFRSLWFRLVEPKFQISPGNLKALDMATQAGD